MIETNFDIRRCLLSHSNCLLSVSVAQWVEFQSVYCFFTLHCSSSLSCRNEYLATDSGGYLCTNNLLCINCLVAGCL